MRIAKAPQVVVGVLPSTHGDLVPEVRRTRGKIGAVLVSEADDCGLDIAGQILKARSCGLRGVIVAGEPVVRGCEGGCVDRPLLLRCDVQGGGSQIVPRRLTAKAQIGRQAGDQIIFQPKSLKSAMERRPRSKPVAMVTPLLAWGRRPGLPAHSPG